MFTESGMEALRPVTKAKSQILVWKDVTVRDLERLERAQSDGYLHRALSEWLHVEGGLCAPRASALRDLYYYTVRFCWDCGFSREQTSCVFSVVKETHAACVGSPLGNVAECYRHFQDLLLCHAVHRPPSSISLFSAQQLLHISDYMVKTYFRHFKLYKYVFTPQVNLDLAVIYEGFSETEDTEPIDEGVDGSSEDWHSRGGGGLGMVGFTQDQEKSGPGGGAQ